MDNDEIIANRKPFLVDKELDRLLDQARADERAKIINLISKYEDDEANTIIQKIKEMK